MASHRERVAASVLAAALGLSGCGGDDTKGDDPGSVPTSPTGVATTGPTSGVPAGTASSAPGSTSGDGTAPSGLPDGFPAAQVPVVAGTVVGGSKGAAGDPYDYTVIVEVRGRSVSAVMQGIAQQLTAKGFTAEATPATEALSAATFRGAEYDVPVNVVRARGTTTVTYLVIRK